MKRPRTIKLPKPKPSRVRTSAESVGPAQMLTAGASGSMFKQPPARRRGRK